jgi:membrane-bound ClpP family serine protease
MSDYVVSAGAYLVAIIASWLYARRSKSGYLRWQWRRPQWILLRLLIVILIFHGGFAWLGIAPLKGYAVVVGIAGLCVLADITGVFALLAGAVGFIFREWIFWFPARHELILRTKKTVATMVDQSLVGTTGQALSDLKLVGKIEVNGREFYARSEAGLVRKGENVMITSVGDFELVVRPAEPRAK